MNRLVYAVLAAGAVGTASSCVLIIGDRAEMEVAWAVDGTSDDPDVADGCRELGATGVEVVTRRRGSDSFDIDIFDCERGYGVIERRTGDYDVWVNAIDGEDRLYGQSVIVDGISLQTTDDFVVVGDYLPAGDFGFLNGQFEATWELYDDLDGQPRTCSEVGVGGVAVDAEVIGRFGTAFIDIFDCPSGATYGDVVTGPLPLADYDVEVAVLESGTDRRLSDPVVHRGEIVNHATVVDLEIYEFYFR